MMEGEEEDKVVETAVEIYESETDSSERKPRSKERGPDIFEFAYLPCYCLMQILECGCFYLYKKIIWPSNALYLLDLGNLS